MELLDVLAKDIGVMGVFSDWAATVTYKALACLRNGKIKGRGFMVRKSQ
jgi:hypothetical protein